MEQDLTEFIPIDPITGKAQVAKKDPITGKLISNPSTTSVDISLAVPSFQTQDRLETYAKYNTPLSSKFNLEEERALRQARSEKWRNGAAKMFTTAFGSFTEGTVGMVDGIIEALVHKDETKLYDNKVGNAIDNMNEWMAENYPNYVTQEEQNTKGLAALGYANFWADKALNGVGYMLGTVGSVMTLSGSASLAFKAMSPALRGLKVAKAISSGTQASKMLSGSTNILANTAKYGGQAALGMTSAFAESSVEAREVLRATEERLLQEEAARLGVAEFSLPKEVRDSIKERSVKAANLAFGMNLGVVGFSNMVLFGKIIAPKYFDTKRAGDVLTKSGKNKAWAARQFTKKDAAKEIGEGFLTEGFQEGTQFAIQEQALAMADSLNTDFDRGFGLPEALEALFEGYAETVQSKEGLDSIMVGSIIGMLGGGAGSIRNAIQNKKNTATYQKLAEALNDPELLKFAIKAESLQAQGETLAKLQEAYDNNDHKASRDLQAKAIVEHMLMHSNAGTMDAFLERIQDEAQKDANQFFTDWAVPEKVTKDLTDSQKQTLKNKLITGLQNRVQEFVEVKAKLDYRYSTPERASAAQRAFMSEEEKLQETANILAVQSYKEAILMESLNLSDIDKRVDSLRTELADQLDVVISDDEISPISKLAEKEAKEETKEKTEEDAVDSIIKKYEAREELKSKTTQELRDKLDIALYKLKQTNPDKYQETLEKAKDLVRLLDSRNTVVNSLNNLEAPAEERELYLAQMQLNETKKVQDEYNKKTLAKVEEAINTTTTAKDLNAALKEARESKNQDAIDKITAEKLKRSTREENYLKNELEYSNLEDLKNLNSEKLPAWKAEVLKELIEDMEAKGETDSRKKHTPGKSLVKKSNKDQTDEDTEDDDNDFESENDVDDTDAKKKAKKTIANALGGKKESKKSSTSKKRTPAKKKETTVTTSEIKSDGTTTRSKDRNGVLQGEFLLNEKGDVIVDANGVHSESQDGFLTYSSINGQDPFVEGRKLLKSGVVTAGTKVILRVTETDSWIESGREFADSKNELTERIPIFVYVEHQGKEVAIGMLRGGILNGQSKISALRNAVYESYVESENGEGSSKITTTVESLGESQFFRASDADGNKYFYNPKEALGEAVGIGVVRLTKSGKLTLIENKETKKLSVGNTDSLSEEELDEMYEWAIGMERSESSPLRSALPGAVVFIHRNPDGKFKLVYGHTATLSESSQKEALDLLVLIGTTSGTAQANAIKEFESLVATSKMLGTGVNSMNKFMSIDIVNGIPVLGIKAVNEDGNTIMKNYVPNATASDPLVIRIPLPVLARIIQNPNIETLEEALTGIPKDQFSEISQEEYDQAIKALRNLVARVVIDNEGLTNLQGVASDINENQANKIIEDLPTLIINLLSNKKYNVDAEQLQSNDYINSLLEEISDVDNTGFKGKVSTNVKAIDGNVLIDIGLNFGDKFEVNGVEKDNKFQVTTQKISAKPRNTIFSKKAIPVYGKTLAKKKAKENAALEEDGENLIEHRNNYYVVETAGEDIKITNVGSGKVLNNNSSIAKAVIEKHLKKVNTKEDDTENTGKSILSKKPTKEVTDKSEEKGSSLIKDKKETVAKAKIKKGFNKLKGRSILRASAESNNRLDVDAAKAWLKERGIDVTIFESLQTVGSAVVHGYVQNAMVHLWSNAEVGTEFHEAFHVVFRSMLNDKQRATLYEESKKTKGVATLQELNTLKSQFPDMSLQEIENLAYEERMAEDFRNYVITEQEYGKTLSGKLLKFFKDLWNYIKAVLGFPTDIKQLFSLIEFNRIPKKFVRNAQSIDGSAYRVVEGFEDNIELHKALSETAATIAINQFVKKLDGISQGKSTSEYRSKIVDEVLGNEKEGRLGEVGLYFLENAFYVDSPSRFSMSLITRNKFKGLIESKNDFNTEEEFNDAIRDFVKQNNLKVGVPITNNIQDGVLYKDDLDENSELKDAEDLEDIGRGFLEIVLKWEATVDQFGNRRGGFRDQIIEGIKPAGFNISVGKVFLDTEEEGNDVLKEDEHDEQDKYYFAENIEFNKKDKMGGKLKQLISSLVSPVPNELGFRTYLNVEEVYRFLVSAVVDSQGYSDMMDKLEDRASIFPELSVIYDYLLNDATTEEIAQFRSYFSLGYSDQKFLIEEVVEETEDSAAGIKVKLTGADTKTALKSVFQEWKISAIQTKRQKDNAIIIVTTDENGKFVERKVNDNIVNDQTRTERLNNSHKQLRTSLNYFAKNGKELKSGPYKLDVNNQFNQLVEGIANTAWEMGLQFGVSQNDAAMKLKYYLLNSVRSEDRADVIFGLSESLETIIKSSFKTINSSEGSIQNIESPKETPQDFFRTETSSVKILAEVVAAFKPPQATSIIDPSGKLLWLYNTRSQLGNMVKELNNPNSDLVKNKLSQDAFIAGLPNFEKESASMFFELIKNGRFPINVFSLNSVQTVHGNVVEYKKMSSRDSLIAKLNMYINDGSKEGYFAIPTQETRGRTDYIKLLKASKDKGRTAVEHITSVLIRDLYRLNQDPTLRSKLVDKNGNSTPQNVFIWGKYTEDFVITEEMSSRFAGLNVSQVITAIDSTSPIFAEIQKMATNIVENVIPEIRNEIIQEFEDKGIAEDIDDALVIKYPKNIKDRINAKEITVIQGRREDINSTERNPKPLRIGNKYYFAQYTMDKAPTFSEFSAAMGGREKALTALGVSSIETAPESLKDFLTKGKTLTLYTLTEVSKEDAGVTEDVKLNRINIKWKNKYTSLENLIDSFILDDSLARGEMAALFRGGIGQAKNLTDFFKRMGLLNTPGTEMLMEGEIAQLKTEEFISQSLKDETSDLSQKIQEIESTLGGRNKIEAIEEAKQQAAAEFMETLSEEDKSYGMLKEINQATITKFKLNEVIHNALADQYIELIRQDVNVEYTEEELESIREAYISEKKDISDGIGLISPYMAKKYREGEGKEPLNSKEWEDFVASGYRESSLGYSAPIKPFFADLVMRTVDSVDAEGNPVVNQVLRPDLQKNSHLELRPELVKDNPVLQELYDRMMAIGRYEGMEPIHLINTESAKKGDKSEMVELNAQTNENGELIDPDFAFKLTNESIRKMDGSKLILPQTVNEKRDSLTRLNRQIRKNMLTSLSMEDMYLLSEEEFTGEEVFNIYQKSIREMMRIKQSEVDEMLGVDALMKYDSVENRLNFYKKVKRFFIQQKIERGELDDNMEEQLEIIADGFRMPISTPGYEQAFESLISSIYKREVLKLKLSGKELVQAPAIGPLVKDPVTGKMRELRFLSVRESSNGTRIGEAEVMISYDVAAKYGIKPGDDINQLSDDLKTIIGYRVPHQSKSSTLIMKVVGFLPEGYSKTIIIPGNATVQMGSDFDIDKLFVLFREAEMIGDRAVKIPETYDVTKLKNASIESLRNNIFAVIESISLDPKHSGETLAPLDTQLLENIVTNILGKNIDSEYFFAHPMIEIDMERKFKMAQQLVGVYANGLSGVAVAMHGKLSGGQRGLKISNNKAIQVQNNNGELILLNTIQAKSKQTNKNTTYGMIKRLSAAVDAGKTPLQDALNDNLITANAIMYLESIGMDEIDISLLMNNPLVKDFVEKVDNQSHLSKYKILESMDPKYSNYYLAALEYEDGTEKVLLRGQLERVYQNGNNGIITKTTEKHFEIFLSALVAGQDLFSIYRSITPDVLDTMSDFPSMESYMDGQKEALSRGSNFLISQDQIDQFITGDAYEMQAAFQDAFMHISEVLGQLFTSPHIGVQTLKNTIKDLTGSKMLTPEMHRLLNRAAFWYSASKPVYNSEGKDINPLAELLSTEKIKKLYTDPDKNLWTRIKALVEKYPALKENLFIQMISENENNDSDLNRLYRIKLSSMEKMDTTTRNKLIREFKQLLDDPDFFIVDVVDSNNSKKYKKELAKIKRLGEDLIINAIVSTGMAPGYGAYHRLIPMSFFASLSGKNKNYTFRDHLMREFINTKNNADSLLDALPSIISNFGLRTINGGMPLVKSRLTDFVERVDSLDKNDKSREIITQEVINPKFFEVSEPVTAFLPKGFKFKEDGTITPESKKNTPSLETTPMFVSNVEKFLKHDKRGIFVLTKYGYVEVRPMGLTHQLIEMNLRDANGDIALESIVPERNNEAPALTYKLMYNPFLSDKSTALLKSSSKNLKENDEYSQTC